MIAEYKVYRRISGNENEVYVSFFEIPEYQIRTKKKYVGKKAKIEAIYRLTGIKLPEDYTTEQVNEYLSINLYNTSKWRAYRNQLTQVQSEENVVTEKYQFEYTLIVQFKEDINPSDERIIFLVVAELLGNPCKSYKGLKNSIQSLEKRYN